MTPWIACPMCGFPVDAARGMHTDCEDAYETAREARELAEAYDAATRHLMTPGASFGNKVGPECPDCYGTGWVSDTENGPAMHICPACHGVGHY